MNGAARYCAHYADNQWQRDHTTVATITEAKQWFTTIIDALDRYTDMANAEATLDLYTPGCEQCTSSEVHHDYPYRRYVLGKRGGIRNEAL